ncbi:hypothetical protein KCU67_g1569, partial [Aureobasidium melanogenum]
FEWNSEMDGDVYPSSSEDERDWYAEDPWNALLVLGLRVYSQASGVMIKIRDGTGTDDEEVVPSANAAETDGLSESKAGESEKKLEDAHGQVHSSDSKTTTSEDVVKQDLASNEATLTRGEEDKSLSNTADVSTCPPSSDPTLSNISGTTTIKPEQKN